MPAHLNDLLNKQRKEQVKLIGWIGGYDCDDI
jgi:hypothetical protein